MSETSNLYIFKIKYKDGSIQDEYPVIAPSQQAAETLLTQYNDNIAHMELVEVKPGLKLGQKN